MASGALPPRSPIMTQPTLQREKLSAIFCILIWVMFSCVIIIFNKWILDRFPFSIALTTWHMFFASIATQILSRMTSLIDTSGVNMTPKLYLKVIVPISLCFSISLICSNMVYLYLSVSFIQMLKAIGPVATVLACWSIGLRNPEPSLRVLLTICAITAGVMISSLGELQFVLLGVLIQGFGVTAEAYKNALQQFLLTGKTRMSSLTLLYYFAPACTILNLFCVLVFEAKKLRNQTLSINPLLFLFNGLLTFGLNIASVQTIKKTSSLVLTLCGIPKAMLLVGMDMVLYKTPLTLTQVAGFTIAGMGTYHYSNITQPKPASPVVGTEEEKEELLGRIEDEESQLMGLGLHQSEKRAD